MDRHTRDGETFLPSDLLVRSLLLGGLALLLFAVLVVDVLDVADLASRVGQESGATLWSYLFREGAAAEWLQAAALLGVVFYAGVGAGSAGRVGADGLRNLLTWLALGCSLMLIEDTANASETVTMWLDPFLDLPSAAVRAPIFGAIGLIMLYGPWRNRNVLREHPKALRAFLLGYTFYAVMVAGEVLNQIFDFYVRVGGWVANTLLGGRMRPLPAEVNPALEATGVDVNAFLLMDYVYEETLELVGASFLLVGVLCLLRKLRADHPRTDPPLERDPDPGITELDLQI